LKKVKKIMAKKCTFFGQRGAKLQRYKVGLAYLPGAFFGASTTQATVCVRGSFVMLHFEASENSSVQVWGIFGF
jgi:hypothetical protein